MCICLDSGACLGWASVPHTYLTVSVSVVWAVLVYSVCNVSQITMMMRSRNTVELRSQISVPRQTKTTYRFNYVLNLCCSYFLRADILHVWSILQHMITTLLLLFSGFHFVSLSFHVGLLFQTNQRCMPWFHLHLILYDKLKAQLCNWDV